jgi:hypothetical protein
LRWDEKEKEHLIDFTDKNSMFVAAYPTRKVTEKIY